MVVCRTRHGRTIVRAVHSVQCIVRAALHYAGLANGCKCAARILQLQLRCIMRANGCKLHLFITITYSKFYKLYNGSSILMA